MRINTSILGAILLTFVMLFVYSSCEKATTEATEVASIVEEQVPNVKVFEDAKESELSTVRTAISTQKIDRSFRKIDWESSKRVQYDNGEELMLTPIHSEDGNLALITRLDNIKPTVIELNTPTIEEEQTSIKVFKLNGDTVFDSKNIESGMSSRNLCEDCWYHYFNDYLVNICGPCLLYTSPSPRDLSTPRMPSSA